MFLMMPRRMTDFMHIRRKLSALLVSVKTKITTGIFSLFVLFTFELYFGCCMALAGEC